MDTGESLIRRAYSAFNRHDADAAVSTMRPEVDWSDGEGHMLHGPEAICAHWAEQWKQADIALEPERFVPVSSEEIAVDVRMTVRPREGGAASERKLRNVFVIREGGIERMEIQEASE